VSVGFANPAGAGNDIRRARFGLANPNRLPDLPIRQERGMTSQKRGMGNLII